MRLPSLPEDPEGDLIQLLETPHGVTVVYATVRIWGNPREVPDHGRPSLLHLFHRPR
jgi:hypothetical protein